MMEFLTVALYILRQILPVFENARGRGVGGSVNTASPLKQRARPARQRNRGFCAPLAPRTVTASRALRSTLGLTTGSETHKTGKESERRAKEENETSS